MKQLIILGNGFDLACNLHMTRESAFDANVPYRTSYSDYFDYLIRLITKSKESSSSPFEDLCAVEDFENVRSAWMYIFAWHAQFNCSYGRPACWKDVELLIASFLKGGDIVSTPNGECKPSINGYLDYESLLSYVFSAVPEGYEEKSELLGSLWDLYNAMDRYFKATVLGFCRGIEYDDGDVNPFRAYLSSGESLHYLFLSELKKQERDFMDYLRKLESKDANYIENARRLYKAIKSNASQRECGSSGDVNMVLSFNYTSPLDVDKQHFINVNGNLCDDNAFFGISEFDDIADEKSAIFLKTYRRADCYRSPNGDRRMFFDLLATVKFDAIEVYGSSLGDSDYPYFYNFFFKCFY